MWIILAILSALCLGFYDINKKRALTTLDVVSVLTYSLRISAAILIIPLLYSRLGVDRLGWSCPETLYVPHVSLATHGYILLKSILVLSSWVCAYTSVKYLPLSLVSPMQATRPMWTLIGAVTIFGERPGGWQWAGIALALTSIMVMAGPFSAGKPAPRLFGTTIQGVPPSFTARKRAQGKGEKNMSWWPIVALALSILLGACSGLYDKHMMRHYDHNAVQVWYIVYQAFIMAVVRLVVAQQPFKGLGATPFKGSEASPFKGLGAAPVSGVNWSAVALISVFLVISDYVYFLALTDPRSMIAVVSMIRRGGTIIPFFYGLLVLKEQHPLRKTICLLGIMLGLLCLCLGSI